MKLVEDIVSWADDIVAIRRDIHAHPELAYEEHRSADLVARLLESWGIETHRGLGGTGVVGTLHGQRRTGQGIGLRADMDALPMQEANQFDHASKHPGKMHACGHDGHMAMLLAAARHLARHNTFDGTVHFIFQPAEEGHAGARAMINDGLFQKFPMQAVFGMHNWPGLPEGSFGVCEGAIMASSNTFEILLDGKGAHGGMPHLGADPVMAAAQLAQALQTVVSRNCNPLEPAVLSITQLHAGSADNVIPESAQLRGTVRTFSLETLDLIESRMRELAEHTATAMGCSARFHFERKYPPTINHPEATRFCVETMQQLVGDAGVNSQVQPSMGAEDFAFMLQEVPGCYVWIGNGSGDHRTAGHGLGPCMLHNGSYDFNDALIPLGASYWVELTRRWFALNAA